MADTVSEIAAFVFEKGALADQILFRNLEEDGELPGVTVAEREAMNAVIPEVRDTWISLLSACRAALWRRAAGHPTEAILQTRRTQNDKMWTKHEVKMPLIRDGAAECGIALECWEPSTQYQLHAWVWTQPKVRAAAESAVTLLNPAPWRNTYGSFLLTIKDTPKAGARIEALAEAAAGELWSMAKPIAEAIEAGRRA